MNRGANKIILLLAVAVMGTLLIQPVLAQDTFVYWGGLIFSDAANSMFEDKIREWGEERGINVDVVMINQNETVQRVSAAVEAGTLPDALDLGRDFMLLLAQNGQLEQLDELFEQIGEEHGGWLPGVEQHVKAEELDGVVYGIPYAANGNVLFRRNDVLEPAGYPDAPETWAEMAEMAIAAQNPPEHYGMGIALSNVGDGNITTTMLHSYGGRIANDEGTSCTIDSPEAREFLTWISGVYEQGAFPPGATTWDGAGDNTAYQSGQALFIANPGSVYLYMRDNDPELGDGTRYSALPGGPVMRVSPFSTVVRSIPSTSNHKELAADLLAYLADDEFMAEYFNEAIYGPALESQLGAPVFEESPVHAGLLDLIVNGTPGAFPDKDTAAFAEYQTNFLTPKMVQRVVVDGLSIDEAVMETQAACQAIYDKYQ
ncbi:MAG: hypothetical protein CL610_07375 [Anaerolineaceae bacterium]|nr:hypothetical protein [Anaerolineaceae bacterium]